MRTLVSTHTLAVALAAVVLATASSAFAVWADPTDVPPNANTPAPLNTGATTQTKTGGLWADSMGTDNGYCIGLDCITSWADTGGVWSLNGSNAYYTGGSVGIGTTSPSSGLHVASGDSNFIVNGGGSIELNRDAVSSPGVGGYIDLKKDVDDDMRVRLVYMDDFGSGDQGFAIYLDPDGGTWSATNRFTILDTGEVGIGDTSPDGSLTLDVEGAVGATQYCDENGNNCVTAASLGGASGANCSFGGGEGWPGTPYSHGQLWNDTSCSTNYSLLRTGIFQCWDGTVVTLQSKQCSSNCC